MAILAQKYIDLTTGTDGLTGRSINANFTATNYTPAQVASEGSTKISAHLNGINSKLTTFVLINNGDIALTSFSASQSVGSPTNITGFAFANGVVRGFRALVTITVIATSNLYATWDIMGIQRGSDWQLTSPAFIGDSTNIVFTITSAGQVQYTSPAFAGFTSATIKFTAQVTTI